MKPTEFFRHHVAPVILEHEGGYVNDPADSGGETNYGISLRYLERLPLWIGDVNQDGQIDGADIRALSRDKAIALYQREWSAAKYHTLEHTLLDGNPNSMNQAATGWSLAAKIFDIRVNTGPTRAAKILQAGLNAAASANQLQVDGIIGRKTRAASRYWWAHRPGEVLAAVRATQVAFYRDIATGQRRKFLNGWLRRAMA